ncbi:hypothetical protein MKW92_039341 [Papaver armeniacum]|nr:hypothetical protein MKW92_039341 [Papaver armeniacum]
MSVVLDGPISLAVRKVEEVSEATSAIVFFGLCMVLGISTRHLLRGTKVPYTVALLVIGIGLGSLEFGTNLRLGKLGAGIRLWASINPDLLLAVFLPALLFEGAFLMEVHQIKKCIGQMLILAGPACFSVQLSWKTSLLLAGLLSATDPVAVVALLKELGAIVVYQFFFRMVLGESFSFGDIITYFTQVSLGALGIGLAFGLVSVFWLGFIFNDTVIEISLALAVSYLAYFTAQDGAGVSGILAGDNQQSLHHFLEMVSYIGNTLIFILSGVIISESVTHSGNNFIKHETSWGYLVLLYVLVQVSRAIVVGTLYPFLHYFGYGLDWKEAIVLVWSGLRGVVALSMALSVKITRDSEWHTVKKYLSCLNNLEEDHMHPHNVSKNESNIDVMNLKDTRIRLLIGVQAAYWGMLNDGRISQNTATTLLGSVDEAIDLVSHHSLCDWKGIKSHVHFPSHYRLLQMSICPQKLVTYLTVERLELACYVCAAFLLAHRIARRQLHDFMGDSEIVSLVINESESEGDEARIGILEDKEVIHLHESVQTDLERVLKNPPLAKMPKIDDMLRVHPLLIAICREGSIPNGIWLVSNGVVKWESTNMRNKGSLHPTFSHGSSLGLYEVLSGNPYIYDLITDTVIYCFFVESERIPSLLKADPAVEDILWQESVIVIAKLLLPQIFEKMIMQDLRSLVMERSHMNIYMEGDIIEIPPHCIGFLLEGTVTTITDQEEMITSPGVLSPIYGDLSFLSLETSGSKAASIYHRGTSYQTATRARVIIFDMAKVEADLQLQRRTSSWIYAAEESLNSSHVGSSYEKPTGSQRKELHGHSYTRVPSTEQVQPLGVPFSSNCVQGLKYQSGQT